MSIDTAYQILYFSALIMLGLMIIITLIRTITGKLHVDRIIGLNMTSTMAVIAILILTLLLKEDYIADIAIIYVMLSFISILILCKIYINLFDIKHGSANKFDHTHDDEKKEDKKND